MEPVDYSPAFHFASIKQLRNDPRTKLKVSKAIFPKGMWAVSSCGNLSRQFTRNLLFGDFFGDIFGGVLATFWWRFGGLLVTLWRPFCDFLATFGRLFGNFLGDFLGDFLGCLLWWLFGDYLTTFLATSSRFFWADFMVSLSQLSWRLYGDSLATKPMSETWNETLTDPLPIIWERVLPDNEGRLVFSRSPVADLKMTEKYTPEIERREPQNKFLEKESPSGKHYFQAPC